MKKSCPATAARLYTPRATLCAIGLKIRSLKLFDTVAEHVQIRQKAIKHTPPEKLRGTADGHAAGTLAQNVIIWAKRWLLADGPK